MSKKEYQEDKSIGKLIAKKDFHIVQNEHDIKIKKGDDVSGVPQKFMPNLKTEGVI